MIPKLVHYAWVGGAQPEVVTDRVTRNRALLDEYRFVAWGDRDVQRLLSKHALPFLRHAYEQRKWAFVSDWLKAWALFHYGGIAIDADNVFLKTPDDFLDYRAFSGFENYGGHIASITALMASEPGHPYARFLLDVYEHTDPATLCSIPNTQWIQHALQKAGVVNDDHLQYCPKYDLTLFPSAVFCGPAVQGTTVAVHLFDGSWVKAA